MPTIPSPWQPIHAAQSGDRVTLSFTGREVVQDGALLPTSLQSLGRELLFAPMRLVGEENGMPIAWADEGCCLLDPRPDRAVVNGFAQSGCVVANTTLSWEYDGAARWDVKIMPRGLTVPQVFGLEECPIPAWNLTRLHLQIPLRKDAVRLYVSWPKGGARALRDGAPLPENGRIPEGGMTMPFKAALWLGDEKAGFQIVAESDETWQAADYDRAVEILDEGDHWVLSLRLLDSLPRTWQPPGVNAPHVCFPLGLTVTPVRPPDPSFLKVRAVHIDCFAKIAGDYLPYLLSPVGADDPELVIDKLSRTGVNLLVLHEKWNKIQNYWETPVQTRAEMLRLVKICHARGIHVLPYFGYEISSPMPDFAAIRDDVIWRPDGSLGNESGWYRVPVQRAVKVCYQSEWRDRLCEGILRCIDEFGFDGVYLDTTTAPFGCVNQRHGCGYTGADGRAHATFPIFATRELMKKIYEGVRSRGGVVNPHPSGATLPFVTSFSDMLWDGEHIQRMIWEEGVSNFSLDYFRAEYLGTNIGVPVQFIVYEVPGVWDFDHALSLCLIHGVYPRPNAVGRPLDVMARVWRALDLYGASDASFIGYWENENAWQASHAAIKLSYYRRETLDGGARLLAFVANPTGADVGGARVRVIAEAMGLKAVRAVFDAMENRYIEAPGGEVALSLPPYTYRIFEITLS